METVRNIFHGILDAIKAIWAFIEKMLHYAGVFIGFVARNFPFIIVFLVLGGLIWFMFQVFKSEKPPASEE